MRSLNCSWSEIKRRNSYNDDPTHSQEETATYGQSILQMLFGIVEQPTLLNTDEIRHQTLRMNSRVLWLYNIHRQGYCSVPISCLLERPFLVVPRHPGTVSTCFMLLIISVTPPCQLDHRDR